MTYWILELLIVFGIYILVGRICDGIDSRVGQGPGTTRKKISLKPITIAIVLFLSIIYWI